MKKIINILIIFLIVGCNNRESIQPLENELTQSLEKEAIQSQLEIHQKINYTDLEVIDKGFYVVTNRGDVYNKENLIKFLNHEINSFTMVYYTVEGDMILSYIYYNGNNYHVIMDTTRDRYGWQGYYENEYQTLEIIGYNIILKDNIKIDGNKKNTVYNSIEISTIPNFDPQLIEIVKTD